MLDNLWANLPLYFLIFCCVPMVFMLLAIYWGWRRLADFTSPDVSRIEKNFSDLKKKHPNWDDNRLIQRVIRQQAWRCGVIGAVTSLGGFYTLPVMLPVDVVLSSQVQAALVTFIAQHYGQHHTGEAESRIRTALIMSGGVQASRSTSTLLTRFAVYLMQKSFAKLIPFVGAVIGFGVNYMIASGVGYAAQRWYAGRTQTS
ncbi:MAG: hypothetical protein Kow00117_01650 [Phototrophicales bacterium]